MTRMQAWTKSYRCNLLRSCTAKCRKNAHIADIGGQRRGAPFLVRIDIAANLSLFALDCFHISKHAVRHKSFRELGCSSKPSGVSESNARNRDRRTKADSIAVQTG